MGEATVAVTPPIASSTSNAPAPSASAEPTDRFRRAPHDELPLIRVFVESLRSARNRDSALRDTDLMLERTIQALAQILDLHGEFVAADEARAIVAAAEGVSE